MALNDDEWLCINHSVTQVANEFARIVFSESPLPADSNERVLLSSEVPEAWKSEIPTIDANGRAIVFYDSSQQVLEACWMSANSGVVTITRIHVDTLSFGDSDRQRCMRRSGSHVEALSGQCVVIVGCGSGGSEIATQMAALGLGRMFLIDPDRMEPKNYSLHQAGRNFAGRPKVAAVKSLLENHLYTTETITARYNVVHKADRFRALLRDEKPDLLICATDSLLSQKFLNYCATAFSIPLVIAALVADGRFGRIVSVRPRVGPCFACVRREMNALLEEIEDADLSSFYGIDLETPPEVYRFQVSFVASLAVRVSLSLLASEHFAPFPADTLLWCAEPGSDFPDVFNSEWPLTLKFIPEIKRWTNCDVCGDTALEDFPAGT